MNSTLVSQETPSRSAIIGLALVAGFYAVLAATIGHGVSGNLNAAIALAINAFIAIPLIYWVVKVERRGLVSLGIGRMTPASFGWALFGVVVTFVLMGLYYALIAPHIGAIEGVSTVSKVTALPTYQTVILIACATATEELVFRFYAISRLHWLTGSKWIAWLAPLIVFVGLHLPAYGWVQAIPLMIGSLVFTMLYWLRRDFWCNALCHCAIDLIGIAAVALGQVK